MTRSIPHIGKFFYGQPDKMWEMRVNQKEFLRIALERVQSVSGLQPLPDSKEPFHAFVRLSRQNQ
jgi:hypothetical protein